MAHSTVKKTYEEVKNFFELNGYRVTENTYVNSRTKINTTCPNGHGYLVSYELFHGRGYRCPVCSGNKTKTLEEVKKIFTDRGYIPQFQSYSKNIRPLLVKCKNGHDWKVSLNNFMKGIDCPTCNDMVTKYTIESARHIVNNAGYTLVSSEYINANSKLDMVCPNGHNHSARLAGFNAGERCPSCNPKFSSKAEIEIIEWIKEHYPLAKKIRLSDKPEGKTFELDIHIPELNLAIEYNGIFWHSEKFHDKNYHYEKMKKAKSYGIRLITIFEDEWRDRKNQIKNFLLSTINKNKHNLYARECEIKEVEKKEASEFLDQNHIQGKALLNIAIGLYYENILVGIITGNKHHRQGFNDTLVLNRLAFKDDTSIVGGSSRLVSALKKYAKENSYLKIISWSDNRWSEGNVYEKIGFELKEELLPDYSYVNGQKRISKQSCQKKHLLKKGAVGSTEHEMAKSLGYLRIWDCGKKRWEMDV